MYNTLITGTNRGIGLEMCRQLKAKGHHVMAVCRTPSQELLALDVEVIEDIDVTDDNDLQRLLKYIEGREIDYLINNAGILERNELGHIDFNSVQQQFVVNAMGPLRVTEKLLSVLADDAKIGIVTSRMGSIGDNDSGSSYGYRMSKAAANMAAKSLAVDLKDKGIAVAALHPGYVKTDMTGHQGYVEADQAAAGLIERMMQLNLDNTGHFWHAEGEILPW
ncbi:SDR family oxidoreductase [Marinicella gelatinilytica]|uniref:SDR family oxidoreductase n=1 Tax=Marinicella gelatinilytica TaxID=2996017 RepID=UPI0022609E6E|nr:SDR family oxidoreductase [Marinicella gelatinilytica]MCX7545734.1 SDR family oxidoreductase [Marinicella gelatinilytica]